MSEERELTPTDASELAASGGGQLVDVRTQEEWDAGHLSDARHIPIDALSTGVGQLDQSKPVILYCRGGDRSGAAADALGASGWDARHIAGGLVAWVDAGLPLSPEGGEVAQPSGLPPA